MVCKNMTVPLESLIYPITVSAGLRCVNSETASA
jgi:hypothetical protein